MASDLASEYEVPVKLVAPTATSNDTVDLRAEYDAPPVEDQHAIINDSADKAHQWRMAFDPSVPKEEQTKAARKVFESMLDTFGEKFIQTNKKELAHQWETLNKPLVNLPQAPELPDVPVAGMGNLSVLAGAYNGIAPVISGLTSPLNLGTLGGFGALMKVAQGVGPAATAARHGLTVLKTAFAAQMARGTGEAAGAASVPEGKTAQQQTTDVVSALAQSALTLLAAGSAVGDVVAPSGRTPAVNPNAVNEAIGRATDEKLAEASATLDKPAPPPLVTAEELQAKIDAKAVPIGDRSGRPTGEAEQAVVAEQQRLVDEYLAPAPGTDAHTVLTEELNAQPSAPPAEPLPTEPPAGGPTGIRNAIVDSERKARGLPPAMEPAAREFGTVWDAALKRINENQNAALDLVNEIRDKPRALTDEENALLLHRQIDLQNQFDKVNDRLVNGDEGVTAEQRASDAVQQARLLDDLQDIYDVGKAAGTETGRGLAARKMLANEDFSLARMIVTRRAVNDGRPLTDAQSAEVQSLHDKIAATQKAFDEYVKANDARLAKMEKTQGGTRNTDRNVVSRYISEQADAARARIKERLTGQRSSTIGADLLADYAIVAADYLSRGLEAGAELVKEFGEKIRPYLGEILDKARARMEDASLEAAINAKKERLQARITELEKKIAKGDTSTTPEKMSRPSIREIEELQQRRDSLNNELEAMRVNETKIKDLTEAIKEKERKISEGDLSTKPLAANRPSMPAVEKLKQERDALNKALAKTRQDEAKPDEAAIQAKKLDVLKNLISEKRAMLESGNIEPNRPPLNRPLPKELEVAKQELETLNKQIADIREPVPIIGGERLTKEQIRLRAFKTRTANKTEEYINRTEGEYYEPKPKPEPLKLDEEALRLKAENERAKIDFQTALIKDRLEQRSLPEKAQDTLVRWRRGFLLSGPVTLAKLTGAAALRFATTPIEELAGAAIGRVVPGLMERAPRHGGGLNVRAEAEAITSIFTKGIKDAGQKLKTAKTDLDVLFGKGASGRVRPSDVIPQSLIDFFGNVHAALKAPVMRSEFERSMVKRMEFAIRNGVDVTDPMVQTQIATAAYKDGNRAIFMQDNILSKTFNTAVSAAENLTIGGERSKAGKVIATTARLLLPIVKVPSNIVAEAAEYSVGSVTGSVELAKAYRAGIENLRPEQADNIARQLKKGSLGAAALLIGYYNRDNFGGFYQQGEKRDKKDVAPGAARIADQDIGRSLIHSSLMETIQLGATIGRIEDEKVKGKGTPLYEAIGLSALGLAEELPFVRTPIELAKLFDKNERPTAMGELVKGFVVPQAVSSTAQFLDKDAQGNPIRRKPKGVLEHIETGIPGLRETVRKR